MFFAVIHKNMMEKCKSEKNRVQEEHYYPATVTDIPGQLCKWPWLSALLSNQRDIDMWGTTAICSSWQCSQIKQAALTQTDELGGAVSVNAMLQMDLTLIHKCFVIC